MWRKRKKGSETEADKLKKASQKEEKTEKTEEVIDLSGIKEAVLANTETDNEDIAESVKNKSPEEIRSEIEAMKLISMKRRQAAWVKFVQYLRIVVNFLLMLSGVILFVAFFGKIMRFFLPFVIAIVIAAIANPMVRFLEKKVKLKRKHGSVVIIVIVLAMVVGLLYLAGYLLFYEISNLMEDFPDILKQGKDLWNQISVKLQSILDRLPANIQKDLAGFSKGFDGWLTKMATDFTPPTISQAGNWVRNVIDGVLIAVISIIAAYFFVADRDKIVNKLDEIVPDGISEYYRMITLNIKKAVGGYFRAQFKIMMVIVVILFVGFEILRVPYSFLIALGTAFLDFLPVFGTGTVIGPWVIVDIITGKYIEAIVLVALYLVCQLIRQILQPKMVGDSIGMSPLATLFFMFAGYRFKGILGMIVGIPVGMILVNFYKVGVFDRLIRGAKIIAHDLNRFRKY